MKLIIMMLLPLFLYSQEIPKDKQLHFIAGAGISVPFYAIAKNKWELSSIKSIAFGVSVSSLFGLAKELYDINTTGFDNRDLLYTVGGGVFATLTIDLIK